jgi:hypothetical protein
MELVKQIKTEHDPVALSRYLMNLTAKRAWALNSMIISARTSARRKVKIRRDLRLFLFEPVATRGLAEVAVFVSDIFQTSGFSLWRIN